MDAGGDAYRSARDFVLNGEALGKVLPQAADALKPFFAVTDDAVALDAADPTAVLKDAFDALRAQDAIPMLRGWRDEPFAIRPSLARPARAVVERARRLLGAPAYGVFCTAYVQDASGAPAEVWLGRRSARASRRGPGYWTASRPAAWRPASCRATRWQPSARRRPAC